MRRGKRTREQLAREALLARRRRAAGYVRPLRSAAEVERGRVRARVRRRVQLGWPSDRLASPTRSHVRGRARGRATIEPMPAPAVGHALFDAARSRLRGWEASDLDGDMDSVARDLVSEYVLAVLDGRDGDEAMAAFRARYRRDRAVLVHGTILTSDLDR